MPQSESELKSSRFVVLAAACIILAALYLAQPVLVPLALAIMLSFLLTPALMFLERHGLPRPVAVGVVVSVVFALLFGLLWVVYLQVHDLADRLPQYEENIVSKVRVVREGSGNILGKAAKTLERVREEATSAPSTTQAAGQSGALDPLLPQPAGAAPDHPIYTRPISDGTGRFDAFGSYISVLLGPLGTLGIVIVFVIFMLLQREDLRDRFLRLAGQGQLQVTTQALDDATTRITRYLVAQAIVNGTYGLAITIGLCIIGFVLGGTWFPSFVLWGLLCGLLRFIPYIGPWIGAAFPMLVAFAVFPGYGVFLATVIMFVVVELISNNLMEPMLYGSSTGMSTVAVLVAAVFWTWLWGPIGLLLSTPLTVCIVVIGKHVPALAFLDILLGDQPVLLPHERLFQRLLAGDLEEANELGETFIDENSLEDAYDQMLLPALAMAEQARHSGRLDERRATFMRQAVRDMVDDLAEQERIKIIRRGADETLKGAIGVEAGNQPTPANPLPARPQLPKDCVITVLCLPAHDEADEIVGLMLTQLLQLRGFGSLAVSHNALASEMIKQVQESHADGVVVSALPPAAVTHARYLCKRLTSQIPDLRLMIGLWTAKGDLEKSRRRVGCSDAPIATTLVGAVDTIVERTQSLTLNAKGQA